MRWTELGRSLQRSARSCRHPSRCGTRRARPPCAPRGRSGSQGKCKCTAGGTPCERLRPAASRSRNLATQGGCGTTRAGPPGLHPSRPQAPRTSPGRSRKAPRPCRRRGRCMLRRSTGWSTEALTEALSWCCLPPSAGHRRCRECSPRRPTDRCTDRCPAARRCHSNGRWFRSHTAHRRPLRGSNLERTARSRRRPSPLCTRIAQSA
mmetsp:Transcript_74387/g.177486  ORF Transcript_74387/g.177486 Transcript_74387/m.177486 type:complete len:207 (-) Transcript_74387:158-778(-)